MLEQSKVNELLEQFKEQFTDDFLFALIDLRLPEDEQIPRVVPGHQARGLIMDGDYHAQLVGKNESSGKNLRAKMLEEARAKNPDIKAPLSLADQLAAAKAENEKLKKQLSKGEKSEAPKPAKGDGGKGKKAEAPAAAAEGETEDKEVKANG